MAKRFLDNNIWGEDWFQNLALPHKLCYLYIYTHAEQSGIIRLKRVAMQQQALDGKLFMAKEFIDRVNRDDDGQPFNRILILENKNWFLTSHVSEQIGDVFNWRIGAHRGVLKNLVVNKIHPREIPNFDFGGIELLDFQDVKKLVHVRGMYGVPLGEVLAKVAPSMRLYNNTYTNTNTNTKEESVREENEKGDIPESEYFPDPEDAEELDDLGNAPVLIYPDEKDMGMLLEETEAGGCIEFFRLTKQSVYSKKEIIELFEGFKIQYFDGKKPYYGKSGILKHFRNWVKPKINGYGNKYAAGSNTAQPQSAISELQSLLDRTK